MKSADDLADEIALALACDDDDTLYLHTMVADRDAEVRADERRKALAEAMRDLRFEAGDEKRAGLDEAYKRIHDMLERL